MPGPALSMSEGFREYKVFVASPNDMREAREAIKKRIGQLNDRLGNENNPIRFKISTYDGDLDVWERGDGTTMQDDIDDQLLNESDYMIAIFGKRLGEAPDGGTSHEIQEFLRNRDPRQITIYRQEYEHESERSEATPVKEYTDDLNRENNIVVMPFDDIESLCNRIYDLMSAKAGRSAIEKVEAEHETEKRSWEILQAERDLAEKDIDEIQPKVLDESRHLLHRLPHGSKADLCDDIKAMIKMISYEGARYTVATFGDDIVVEAPRVYIKSVPYGQNLFRPEDEGSGSGTPYHQFREAVCRVVDEECEQTGRETTPFAWRGVLTNGEDWHVWEWPETRSTPDGPSDRHPNDPELLPSLTVGPGQEWELAAWITRVFNRHVAVKPAVPDDLYSSLFRPHLTMLEDIAKPDSGIIAESARATRKTQQILWHDMLRGSGMAPDKDESHDLFLKHTFLVIIARVVIAVLSANDKDKDGDVYNAAEKLAADGFVSWVSKEPRGVEWLRRVYATASCCDWRALDRDVIRTMYQSMIEKKHRKIFGEYYTPDWLAGMIVDKVCDDEWCRTAVAAAVNQQNDEPPKGMAVLDPACGSGTFLFHAARRIAKFMREEEGYTDPEIASYLPHLVVGIDIHPVAVELARATLLRALPKGTDFSRLRVYQGDSLLTPERDDTGGLFEQREDGSYEFQTPERRRFVLPAGFIRQSNLARRLQTFVESAEPTKPNKGLPGRLLGDLSSEDQDMLKEAWEILVDVIKKEGNSVWSWFMFNKLAPRLLAESKVDRIVANPPWVVMSEIQVPERKNTMKDIAKNLNIWGQGKNSSNFDIAGLFVLCCSNNFLRPGLVGQASGWVLPWAAMKGSNWQKTRGQVGPTEQFDLSKVKEPPFGSKACIWITKDDIIDSATRPLGHSATRPLSHSATLCQTSRPGGRGGSITTTPGKRRNANYAQMILQKNTRPNRLTTRKVLVA